MNQSPPRQCESRHEEPERFAARFGGRPNSSRLARTIRSKSVTAQRALRPMTGRRKGHLSAVLICRAVVAVEI